MKSILTQLHNGGSLTAAQSEQVFALIMNGQADPAHVASLLTLLAAREPTIEELIGVAQVMRQHVVRIPVSEKAEVIDTCGTGGVGSRIFNVSTAAALVAAACGVKVAKHGNRSITSRSGSSDLLRLLGVNIDASVETQARCLTEANICFAFAPKHHPAMRHVAPIRQALPFATIFNLIGPLTNPAGARRQLVGVRSPKLADKLLAVLVELGATRAMVVNGNDGTTGGPDGAGNPLCELSISGPTYIVSFDGRQANKWTLNPEDLGLQRHPIADLEINSPEESAALVRAVLGGKQGAPRDMVLLNAAGALWVAGKVDDLRAGLALAAAALDSGAARATIEKLARLSHEI